MENELSKQKKEIESNAYNKNREFDKQKNLKNIEYEQKKVEWDQKMYQANFEGTKQ